MDRFTISNAFFCDSSIPNSAAYEKPPGVNPAAFRVWQRHRGSLDLSERMTRERWNEQLPPRHTPAVRLSWSQDTRNRADAQGVISVLPDICIIISNVLYPRLCFRNAERFLWICTQKKPSPTRGRWHGEAVTDEVVYFPFMQRCPPHQSASG